MNTPSYVNSWGGRACNLNLRTCQNICKMSFQFWIWNIHELQNKNTWKLSSKCKLKIMLKIVGQKIGKSIFLELPSWLEVVSLAEGRNHITKHWWGFSWKWYFKDFDWVHIFVGLLKFLGLLWISSSLSKNLGTRIDANVLRMHLLQKWSLFSLVLRLALRFCPFVFVPWESPIFPHRFRLIHYLLWKIYLVWDSGKKGLISSPNICFGGHTCLSVHL